MKVTETMIEAFFSNELNEYQSGLVKDYFRQNPEAMQKYLTGKNWEDFSSNERLAVPVTDKMFRVITSGIYKKNRIRRMYHQWGSVAATVIILSVGYQFLVNKAATRPPAPARENPLAQAESLWKDEVNHTGKTMKISLKDGSQVELGEGGKIHYRESFAPDKRDIYLTGNALFNVGKDKTRPFTVYAGRLNVTALGTVFRVAAPGDENRKTEVRLLSGKVVVRPDSLLEKKGIRAVCLAPGQSLLLDKEKFTVSLSRRQDGNGLDLKKLGVRELTKTFVFNNESLADIFKELGADYRVRFVYRQDVLKNGTFTGRFNAQKETLENFLSTIAILNNLTIRQGRNGIYINQ